MTASISGGGLDFWPRNPASNKAPWGAKRVPVAAPKTPASAISAAAAESSRQTVRMTTEFNEITG